MRKSSREAFAINLKYYRYLAKLSQDDFAAEIGTNLIYECELENCKRNPSFAELDKISQNLSRLIKKDISSCELITYNPKRIINSKRIDEK